MKKLIALAAALVLTALPLRAGESTVVVELFTSQGCSSCPPADAYLRDLALRDGVIALALHVDYWDYIGWQDSFGQPAWSERQRGYAAAAGRNMVYTPQMIINGMDDVAGSRPKDVEALIATHAAKPPVMTLRALREGDRLSVEGSETMDLQGQFRVQLVRLMPMQQVEITRGENAGQTLSYTNVVTGIETLGQWPGHGPIAFEGRMTGTQSGVILIQSEPLGEIVAAAKVE